MYSVEQQLELAQYENKLMKLTNERLEREVELLRWEVGLQKQHVVSLEAMVFGAVREYISNCTSNLFALFVPFFVSSFVVVLFVCILL